MKKMLSAVVAAGLLGYAGNVAAREPIIDMHVHALTADDQGPPPLAMCTPLNPMPTWDNSKTILDMFVGTFKKPNCTDPIWSPETTEEVMRRSLAVMEKHNVIGVVSGRMKLLQAWKAASPDRVMPSLMPDLPIPAEFGKELADIKKSGGIT
ncbi:MAG: hypothetical protein ACOVNK_00035, partial [Sphingorhabdus lacus]